jgi:hypothetical protein
MQWIKFLSGYKDTESGKQTVLYTVNKVNAKVRRPERMAHTTIKDSDIRDYNFEVNIEIFDTL